MEIIWTEMLDMNNMNAAVVWNQKEMSKVKPSRSEIRTRAEGGKINLSSLLSYIF